MFLRNRLSFFLLLFCAVAITCQYNSFYRCKNGKTFTKDQLCDSNIDCLDESDEGAICDCSPSQVFNCRPFNETLNDCIYKEYVCDGVIDCSNGLDEIDCEEEGKQCPFRCGNGRCLGSTLMVKDAIDNCGDNTDEGDLGLIYNTI